MAGRRSLVLVLIGQIVEPGGRWGAPGQRRCAARRRGGGQVSARATDDRGWAEEAEAPSAPPSPPPTRPPPAEHRSQDQQQDGEAAADAAAALAARLRRAG